MRSGCLKHNGVLAGLAGIMGLACSPIARAVDYVPLTDFSTNPASAGWTLASGSGSGGDTTSWDSSNKWLSAGTSSTGGGWYTPVFNPTAGQYYQIQYDAKLTTPSGKGFCWVNFGNPGATYNLETPPNTTSDGGGYLYKTTSTGAQYISGQLLADNATSIQTNMGTSLGNGWTRYTMYTRVPTNATQSFVYFGSNGSSPASGVQIDNVKINSATHADVLTWSDALYSNAANFPAKIGTTMVGSKTLPATYMPDTRFNNLPTTINKLRTHQNLNVVLLGDSIIQDTTNSYFDTMIERNFPGSSVTVQEAQGHGTGMQNWLNPSNSSWSQYPLKLTQAVYNQPAGTLVIIGGISNGLGDTNPSTLVNTPGTNEYATKQIVEALKARGMEVLLTSGDFGSNSGNPLDSAKFLAGTDYTVPYRNWMSSLAQSEGVGYFDTYGAWASYLIALRAAGETDSVYYRDQWTHGNMVGKEIVGQLYSSYFTDVPEPASMGVFVFGVLLLNRNRRHAAD